MRKTKKEIARNIIEGYINDMREMGDGYGIVDKFDSAINMAFMTGMITADEKKDFNKRFDAVYYGEEEWVEEI